MSVIMFFVALVFVCGVCCSFFVLRPDFGREQTSREEQRSRGAESRQAEKLKKLCLYK